MGGGWNEGHLVGDGGSALTSGVGARIALLSPAPSPWACGCLVPISPAPTPDLNTAPTQGLHRPRAPSQEKPELQPNLSYRVGHKYPPSHSCLSLLLLYFCFETVILGFNYQSTHIVTIALSHLLCALRAACTGCSQASSFWLGRGLGGRAGQWGHSQDSQHRKKVYMWGVGWG